MSSEFKALTEVIDLPSRGWFYPSDHPLASGQIELYYMTTRHEDILTSKNLIQKGIVLDKLLEALIATPGVSLNDLLIGDKNGLLIAARIMGYGKNYDVSVTCPKCNETSETVVNLEDLPEVGIPSDQSLKGKNEFEFTLPISKKKVTFSLPTQKDEARIEGELVAMKKFDKSDVDRAVSTRMKQMIRSVDGEYDAASVKQFVDNMPARDGQALRDYATTINPDIDLKTTFSCGSCGWAGEVKMPMSSNFFWPNARV